jgi:competence protein ComEA
VEPSSAPWRVLETTDPDDAGSPAAQRDVPWAAIAGVALVAAIAIAAFLLAARSQPDVGVVGAGGIAAGPEDLTGLPAGGPAATAGEIVVDVGGAVSRPGVYRLPAGSRIGDAVAAAGGYGPRVDTGAADRGLNLAAVLRDGDEIHVPSRDEAQSSGTSGGGTSGGGTSGRLDLNSATAAELDTLPGVGPATAAKIIAAREDQRFAAVDDLLTRKVVGQATLDKIRDLVGVGP